MFMEHNWSEGWSLIVSKVCSFEHIYRISPQNKQLRDEISKPKQRERTFRSKAVQHILKEKRATAHNSIFLTVSCSIGLLLLILLCAWVAPPLALHKFFLLYMRHASIHTYECACVCLLLKFTRKLIHTTEGKMEERHTTAIIITRSPQCFSSASWTARLSFPSSSLTYQD